MKIEQKRIRAEIKQATDKGEFEAVIATLNTVDSDGDIIVPGAFGGATMSVVPAHDHSSVPLGKAKMEDRGDLAIAVGQFNLDIPAAADWHNALKFDLANPPAVQEWSFAFRVMESEEETRDGEPVRILKRLDIMEVSPVLRGAGVGTATLAVKQTFEAHLDKVLKAVDDVIERAGQIAKMRADKPKPKALPEERKAKIAELSEKFETLQATLKACEEKVAGKSDDDDRDEDYPEGLVDAEMLANEVARLGVSIDE